MRDRPSYPRPACPPGLFGFGIAFPESHTNPLGLTEHRVGLYKFMQYLDTVLPLWMRYGA